MKDSEEESLDCYKVESPKLQAEPSDHHLIDSSSRQTYSLFSLTADEFHGKNLEDLIDKFWDSEGNQITSNAHQEIPTTEGQQNLSFGAESVTRDDQIFEQVAGDFVGQHEYPSEQIVPANNDEKSNSDVSEAATAATAASNRRRRSPSSEETVMDKRQRRMIKNRESAQRSRARKQAYTAELEKELNRLREENARLKSLVARVAKAGSEEEETTQAQWVTNKLRKLRRVSSGSW